MYHFSRSIYRELAPRVVEDDRNPRGCRNRQAVLDACETAMLRLIVDGRYFKRPARSLFRQIRPYFKVSDQLHVWKVVDVNIKLAVEFLARPPSGVSIDGQPLRCHAYTRHSTRCQRPPLPGRAYCPSHKRLEEAFDDVELPAAA